MLELLLQDIIISNNYYGHVSSQSRGVESDKTHFAILRSTVGRSIHDATYRSIGWGFDSFPLVK